MRRKLSSHGPSSITVSLPPSWIKQNNLKKGEEIEVIEEENSILIKPVTAVQEVKVTEISFINLDKDVQEDLILALHKKGYDEIKIKIDSLDRIKDIHAFLNRMQLGFEIIKQESDAITIRNISNPEIEQFDSLFRRVFRIVIEYANKVEEIMQNKEEMTHSYILHEVSINRISNYCKRIIVKEKRKNACFFYAIIEELNNITSNLTLLLNEIMNVEGKMPSNVVMKYSEVTNILIRLYELYYKFSIGDYGKIKRDLESCRKSIIKQRYKNVKETNFWDNIEIVREGIQNLMESTLAVQY